MVRLAAITLALAALLHIGIVWLVPRAITGVVMSRIVGQVGENQALTTPLPNATSRGVVMPSPDLLYAICVFDLAAGPLHVTARPSADYWSLALYDRNSDNFYTVNDKELAGAPLDLLVGIEAADATLLARFPTARSVRAPHATGVVLVRGLVLDRSNMTAALATQASVQCAPVTPR